VDLTTKIGSLTLRNPVIAASGCFGYGLEYRHVVDLASLGGVCVKGLYMAEREGHPPQRIVETPSGMLNAIGLQGVGVHRFVKEHLPGLREAGATVFVNICGTTLDEYVQVAKVLSDAEGVAAIELNISCPNIKEGGIQFGCSLDGTYGVVSAVRQVTHLPVIPKLTPNVTSPASFARAAADAGADAISLVNTFLAMAIDVETRKPILSNGMGGLSGPAIRPIAVRMVYECRQAVSIPIIGMGGIMDARDAIETKNAALAAARHTDVDLDRIEAALEAMAADIAAGGHGIEADEQFHDAVTQAAHSGLLAQMTSAIAGLIADPRLESLSRPGRPRAALRQHQAIAQAIRAGDSKTAARAMHRHLADSASTGHRGVE